MATEGDCTRVSTDYQLVDGFPIPSIFSAEAFRSAVNYKPCADDVIVATYPKCGTTWTQQTLMLVLKQGRPLDTIFEFFAATPYLEFMGADAVKTMPRPGIIKVHLPFHLTPWSDEAKYIYVARNPKDCCVSYFYHMKGMPGHGYTGTFDQFFEQFISGDIDYGDYFDHLLGWYEHRNDPNVLFVTYEQMKENPREAILKMASFIDDEAYGKPLREDSELMDNVLHHSSFDYMKAKFNKEMDFISSPPDEKILGQMPEAMRTIFSKLENVPQEKKGPVQFIRKGVIGDWRNHFTDDQSRRMDEKFEERTKGTDIPNLWKNYL